MLRAILIALILFAVVSIWMYMVRTLFKKDTYELTGETIRVSRNDTMRRFKAYVADTCFHSRYGGEFVWKGDTLLFHKNAFWRVELNVKDWTIRVQDVEVQDVDYYESSNQDVTREWKHVQNNGGIAVIVIDRK